MNQEKMHLINKIFNNEKIRTVWDKEKEKYYISVVDVVSVLTGSDRPRKYWSDLKNKLKQEGSELSEKIGQKKLKWLKELKRYGIITTKGSSLRVKTLIKKYRLKSCRPLYLSYDGYFLLYKEMI